ncbi:deoxyribose-phosphate aldolase [bacterium]|nr:deoxyribose-phosphate aldolase [candidate division CSSED10-310 bacterium]
MNNVLQSGADRIGTKPGFGAPPDGLGKYIDHTLLKPEATTEDIDKLCKEAIQYKFAAVCVNPVHVQRAVKNLDGSGIPVAAVVGFPLGAVTATIKAAETREAVLKGAREIDMVLNIGALKAGDYKLIYDEIKAVVEAAGTNPVKVILETSLLNADQKIAACVLSKAAGATFVKTSTGFGPGGATVEDVALMRRIVGPEMGVKASGGIRDEKTAQEMVSAGASRIGASASVAIVSGKQ